ncbi:MAG: nicotinate-nucleotide--dimethylbenzimidazole phosphoribosyltransferase [Actinobacteria bacterium]|nr:nicotinate-nucleotide--dimethylbenzimidazole phosphoribosyltransferase [Actinomycetota bacterium]
MPDEDAAAAAAGRQLTLTKPAGALGRLEELSVWMCAVQGQCPPTPFRHPALVIFAGDHGIARTASTSAYPPEVTAQMVANFVTGGAAANVLARQMGATVRVVDVSVDADAGYLDAIDPSVAARRIRRSCGSIDREDAMTLDETAAAIALGRALTHEEQSAGADLLIAGDMGIGNTTPAATLIGLLTGTDAATVTGRGTGIDDATLTRKASAVAAAMSRGAEALDDPTLLLARVGSPDIAAMTGYLAEASARGIPVILDGIVSCAAALVAERLSPGACDWWIAGHRSTEPAASAALTALSLDPLIDLGLRLGEGTGALLAIPLLTAAAGTLSEMATFDSAGVTDRDA